MKTYTELEVEERDAELNAAYDDVNERFAGEDGSAEFNRREYASYLADMEEAVRATGQPSWKQKGYRGVMPSPDQQATHDILFGQCAAGIAKAKKFFADNPDVPF